MTQHKTPIQDIRALLDGLDEYFSLCNDVSATLRRLRVEIERPAPAPPESGAIDYVTARTWATGWIAGYAASRVAMARAIADPPTAVDSTRNGPSAPSGYPCGGPDRFRHSSNNAFLCVHCGWPEGNHV